MHRYNEKYIYLYVQQNCLELIKGRFNFFFKEIVEWGEQEIIRFRWMLIVVIVVFIGYRYASGVTEWSNMAILFVLFSSGYNLVLSFLNKKFKSSVWLSYFSTTVDTLLLSFYIFSYSYYYNITAISSSATLLFYPLLIMFAVLRYNGHLVIYTTVLVIVSNNITYALVSSEITGALINQIVSIDWAGQIFKSAYLALMGYFMFSIPKIMDKLIARQVGIAKEHNKTEIKLALLKQKEKLVSLQLDKEKALNEKLNNQAMLINMDKEKLEAANTTKDRLFSIVGHDLRSPFSVQCSLSELLEADYDNLSKEEVLEIIGAINKSAHQGIGLLSNLLDWATAENSDESFIPGPVSIQKIVSEAIALFHNNAKYKEIEITTSIDNDLTICVDGNMLETIIRNLLSNALKFSPKRSIVDIEAVKKANDVLIYVKDNGIGMTEEQISGLFKISRDSSPGTEDEPGTGVGLMLCKELVEKNNGSIKVQSIPDKGTIFTIKLPAFSQSSVN